ncbi:MAG TPA: hypothetical protein VN706_03150 [Gemmatimonadaceae bacterium]|nr:hypothetical protein [Gemmatimonadaceae bacterium]
MYDASFDGTGTKGRWLWIIRLAAVLAVVIAGSADAQMPGTPILQNAWATPGVVGAIDIGGGSDGSVYAAAASWTPGSGRFEVSGGAGFASHTGGSSGGVYGARVALPLGGASGSFGFGAFAGIGGGGSVKRTTATTAGTIDSTSSSTQIPVGAAVGWRHAIGSARGFSIFGTPSYVFETGGGSGNKGLFRVGVGADFGITSSLGATVGGEFGATRARGLGGPSGSLFGVGVSYAFGKR